MSDQPTNPILGPGDEAAGEANATRTVPVSHPNYDAQREEVLRAQMAIERQEVGAKMLEVLKEIRDNSDASLGALVASVREIGIDLVNIRAQLPIIMEAVEGHPGIVVGQDFRDAPDEVRVYLNEETMAGIILSSVFPEQEVVPIEDYQDWQQEGARRAARVILGLPVAEAEPADLPLDSDPEPSDDRKELDEYFARQTGAARPAAEAALPGKKLTATPEQIVALEERQRDRDSRMVAVACVGIADLGIAHTRTLMTPMPRGWVCGLCRREQPYHADELPDAPRLVQEEAAEARQAHDEARAPKSEFAQNRKPVPLAPMPPLPEYDMRNALESAFKAYDEDRGYKNDKTHVTGVKTSIINAINAFNKAHANVTAEQIMAQMAALDGPSNARLSTSFKDGMWAGMNNALKIVRGEV